jgi:hypothetical protein
MINRNEEEEQTMAHEMFDENVSRDSSVAGGVTLLIGVGLLALGAYHAHQVLQAQPGSLPARWASEESTRMAAALSVAQIATSSAKLAINGRYHGSPVGIAADVFSVAQLAIFAIGSLNPPRATTGGYADAAALIKAIAAQNSPIRAGHRYVTDEGFEYDTFRDDNNQMRIRRVG